MHIYTIHYDFVTSCDITVEASCEQEAVNIGNEIIDNSLPNQSVLPEDDALNQIIAGLTRNSIVTVEKKSNK